MKQGKKGRFKLLYSLTITLGVGTIVGLATASSIGQWYRRLAKPTFTPPNWVFAPTWTILYILMGISLYIVWKDEATKYRRKALSFFFSQLALNFSWSFVFFSFHQIGPALVIILLLWILILITIVYFARFNTTAAFLLAPYLAWVGLATILNAAIYQLN
jgi:benzodiazapine receptor